MTTCKLLKLQDLLYKALTEDDTTALIAALVIVDEEVAEIVSSDDEKSELDALYKED